jgi:predicted nucleic acid-binding Zn ribbon protein
MYNYSETICSASCESFMSQNYVSKDQMESMVILACIGYIITVAIINKFK